MRQVEASEAQRGPPYSESQLIRSLCKWNIESQSKYKTVFNILPQKYVWSHLRLEVKRKIEWKKTRQDRSVYKEEGEMRCEVG